MATPQFALGDTFVGFGLELSEPRTFDWVTQGVWVTSLCLGLCKTAYISQCRVRSSNLRPEWGAQRLGTAGSPGLIPGSMNVVVR